MRAVWWLSHVSSVLGFLLAVFFLSRILRERRPPASTLAWLLAIVLVPYVGVPLYLMIGGRKHRRMAALKEPLASLSASMPPEDVPHLVERVLSVGGGSRLVHGNHIEVLGTGEGAFAALLEQIEAATQTIHVSTFILAGDDSGNAVVDALTRKAGAGVSVRVLLDGLFSFRADRNKLAALQAAGGKVAVFMPMLRLPFRGPANLRNHRKIIVIDGERAMVGGMNLAREYMGAAPVPERWRDLALLLQGPAVTHLEQIFRSDWAFAAGRVAAVPGRPLPVSPAGDASVQVVASGPDVPGDTYYDAILSLLFMARERIWIATPYFIPDEALARALVLAVRRGVDVRLVVPLRSNHLSADIAGGSYLRQVQVAGGQVRPYSPGMMHAKIALIDQEVAVIGSANLDMRSLFLDYEIALFVYGKQETALFAQWFDDLLQHCAPRLPEAGRARAMAEDLGRLLAPLM
jgi:cardiolipin synthase